LSFLSSGASGVAQVYGPLVLAASSWPAFTSGAGDAPSLKPRASAVRRRNALDTFAQAEQQPMCRFKCGFVSLGRARQRPECPELELKEGSFLDFAEIGRMLVGVS
jgi:hypothetical protein